MVMKKSLPKPIFNNNRGLNKVEARRSLTAADKEALPFLGKKCTDKNDPEFGMWQEDRLVKYINDRMQLSDAERRDRVMRMNDIDIQLSGVVNLDKEDRKRDRSNKKGGKPKPIAHNLPLAYAQLDDCVTYCMSLFAPDTNMFTATSSAENQSVAEGLTKEIGKQGQTLQYYRQMTKLVLNAIKYNLGCAGINWEENTGIIFSPDGADTTTGGLKKTKGTVWKGNVLKSLDMYNFLYDTSVHPVDLARSGEYFATVELVTPFRAKRMAEQKQIFGINRYVQTYAPLSGTDSVSYYISPPIIRERTEATSHEGSATNWSSILRAPGGPARDSQPGLEFVYFTAWMNPKKFDLIANAPDELQLWRLCMANGKYITSAFSIDDSHGMLPIACASPVEDDLRNDQRSYAEMLFPLQHFASFLLNTHVEATRKAIYGITVYESSFFPGLDLSTEDLIGARIAMKSSASGVDIDKAFRHYNDAPQTDQNVEMVEKIVQLMQKILPTNQAQQVADLERATEYQAAATVQASSRRQLKIARLINDQAISVIKFQMMYNMYSNMTLIEYIDQNGTKQQITPVQLLNAQIEFDIGTGLKGLDKLQQVAIFKDLMSYLFQVKDIGQQVDLLGLLSYVTQLAGFESDLSQFKFKQPQQIPGIGHNGGPPLDGTAPPVQANGTTAPPITVQ